MFPLADIDNSNLGMIVQGLSAITTMVLTVVLLFRSAGGKDSERQVEPTEMHAIATELRQQTVTLNKLDREMGGMQQGIKAVDDKVAGVAEQTDKAFQRINAISIESAKTSARVEGLEQREGRRG